METYDYNDHLLPRQLAINFDHMTGKIKAKTNFPKDNAGAPQASDNFQDTHKILKAGKESNVVSDD